MKLPFIPITKEETRLVQVGYLQIRQKHKKYYWTNNIYSFCLLVATPEVNFRNQDQIKNNLRFLSSRTVYSPTLFLSVTRSCENKSHKTFFQVLSFSLTQEIWNLQLGMKYLFSKVGEKLEICSTSGHTTKDFHGIFRQDTIFWTFFFALLAIR